MMKLTPDEARQGCKAGQGEVCCVYLAARLGFVCGRTELWLKNAIDDRVQAGTLTAKRVPTKPYPECQE